MTLAIATNTFDSYVLGVHLRRDRVEAAVVEGRSLLRRHSRELGTELDPDQVVEGLVAAIRALDPRPSAAGLAIPGEMDGAGRCWGMPDFRGFDGVHLGEELASRLECPVFFESEGNAAAIGEQRYGHGRAHPSMLSVLLDERLGAGLVLRGELHRGNSGFAGQLAHLCIRTEDSARACDCGKRGCLDAYASLRALADDYERRAGARKGPEEILDEASQGDGPAALALQSLGESLGSGIALVQNMLDVDAIVLLCSSPALARWLEPALRAALRDRVYGASASEVPLFESSLGSDAVLLGAAALAQEAVAAAEAQGA